MAQSAQSAQSRPAFAVPIGEGRVIAVDRQGRSDGRPVLFLTSGFGSRLLDPDPAASANAGVMLTTLDRPGYGASSPLRLDTVPTVSMIADDVASALPLVGMQCVDVIGWSAGGVIAAALASRHPALVNALALVATPAPGHAERSLAPEQIVGLARLRAHPPSAYAMVREALAPFVAAPSAAIRQIATGAADDAILARPASHSALERMVREGLRPGAAGAAADIVAGLVSPWGFDVHAIKASTTLFYGLDDQLVGVESGEWWAAEIPRATLRVIPAAGHLLPLHSWPEIIGAAT